MDQKSIVEPYTCAYCGTWTGHDAEYVIHRDGYEQGPEVPLCSTCGCANGPSCTEIWNRISRCNKPTPKFMLN
jgi:hypothetical protein